MRTFALILTGLSTAWMVPASAPVPRPSPELILQRGAGAPLKISQFRGKIVALALGHTTCDHCQFLTTTLKKIQTDSRTRNVR